MGDLERILWYYAAGRLFMPRPRYLCFNCTLRCDNRCRHCGIWSDKETARPLTAADLRPVLSQPLFSEIQTAWLTGGEPTIREDLDQLASLLTGALPRLRNIGLATNGILTARVMTRIRQMLPALDPRRHGLFIHISLDGYGPVHDRIRSREGAFGMILGTLAEIAAMRKERPEYSIETGFNCVIQPENVDDLPNIHRFARERGISLTFNPVVITDQIYRTIDKADELSFTDEQRQKVIAFLKSIERESLPVFRYQYRIIQEMLKGRRRPRRCLTLYSTININYDGTIIPCPAASDVFPENVAGQDLQSLWNSRSAQEMRELIHRKFCPDCMLSCSLGDAMSVWDRLEGSWEEKA